jgi:hypothetical protein
MFDQPQRYSDALDVRLDSDSLLARPDSGANPEEEPETGKKRQLLQPALRIIAEAGWITVVYSALAVMAGHAAPILGPVEFALLVLAGVLVGWIGRPREGLGPVLLIVAVVAGGALGWLASPEAREVLLNPAKALGIHLAGWMAGVAVLRGAIVNTGEKAAEEIERLIRIVPAGMALIWAYMAIAAPKDLWLDFAISAMWGTVAFLGASVVSIGLARLNVLHSGAVDARQRRAWRWLVIAIGFGIVPVAVPIMVLSGMPLAAILTPVSGPLLLVGGLLVIPLQGIVWILSEIFRPFAGNIGAFLDQLAARLNGRQPIKQEESELLGTLIGLGLWILTILLVLLAIFLFARWLLSRKRGWGQELDKDSADVEHAFVLPPAEPAAARRRGFRRRGAPHDAVAAYMSALHELESHGEYARFDSETPAAHAARLRRMRAPGAAQMARLAADYQLARYGERQITPAENARAVTRFQRLRRLLRAPAS